MSWFHASTLRLIYYIINNLKNVLKGFLMVF